MKREITVQAPILLMMGFVPLFIRFRTAVDRVQELQLVEVEEEVEQEYIAAPQNIEISQLSFRYDDKLVIKDLSAKFIAGRPAAVIGSSGKGKTTLIRLLLALIKPDKGENVGQLSCLPDQNAAYLCSQELIKNNKL